MEIMKISKEAAWDIRHRVMWPDQDLAYVKLQDDDNGIHYGLFAEARLVSVISLFTGPSGAQFRKFATLQDEQGKGYGSESLRYVINQAQATGASKIWCNARKNKSPYYRKFGLEETDRRFMKGGIEYVVMEKYFDE
ncbi:GNAT family N-acetyltransferase [Paenibacillus sp. P26]|nr:GNAT family N-acetyltransferase [Paenibacillus sp. P26]